MKHTLSILAGWLLAAGAMAADNARLALWITAPIGATNGSQCNLPLTTGLAGKLSSTPPTLTEHDVVAWDATTGRWTLDPARYTGSESAQKLYDHCFVLAIDGKPVSSGIVLSDYSARLTRFPTLSIITRNKQIELELLSGNHGGILHPPHIEALDNVLRQKTAAAK